MPPAIQPPKEPEELAPPRALRIICFSIISTILSRKSEANLRKASPAFLNASLRLDAADYQMPGTQR